MDSNQFLYETLNAVSSMGFLRKEVPDSVAQNLNPKYELRPYQVEAFARLIEKTKDNFLNPSSIKYLFNQELVISNRRVRAGLPVRLLELPRLPNKGGRIHDAIRGERKAFSGIACDFIPFTVYDRYKLFPGATFTGPAIVEERESTVIVGEDATVKVDEFGFLWIEMQG